MMNSDNNVLNKSHLHATDTLLDCLIFICRMNGIGISRDALSAGLPLSDGKITPALFKRAAARANLSSSILKKPLANIRTEYLPAVLLLENAEACLLVGFDVEQQQARVVFPEVGEAEVSVPLDNLASRYSGYAIVAKPKFNFDQRAPAVGKVKLKHWFWGVLAENSNIYRDIMLAAFLINLFALAMPLFSMNVYDRIVPNHAVETLWVLVIGVSLMIGADWLLRTIRAYFLDWASHRVDIKLSASIMEQVLGLRMDQRPMSVGSFAANLRSFETVRDFITSATITTIIDIPFAIIFIAVMAWVSVWMIIPVVTAIVVMLVYALSVQAKMHDLSETMYRASALRNATLIESLVGLETVKSLGIESHMQRKWELSAAFLTEVGSKLKTLSTSINHTAMSIQQLVTVILILLGVYLVVAGHLTMGGMIACTMLAGRALAPFAQAAGLMAQYYSASTSLASLDEIMSKPIERPVDASFLSRPIFNGDIEFRDVTFNYPGTDMHALRNVSFKIRAGEHVALLGRMGSGKTTIHKLILGLYQPLSGSILIDGVDTRQIDPAELRRSIGCVQQDTQLFFGTMRDNIAIAAPYATDEQIVNAAKTGGIDEFINHHPKGFDMQVGERGETLSGGQRQGVGIARAMVQEPAIVLLDEPTSAMDFSGEEMVKKRLIEQTQGKTLLVISHRSSLFDMVERIIVVDNGKVVADGNKLQVIEALKTGQIGKSS